LKADTDPKSECTKDDKACIEDTCSGTAGACKPAATPVVCRAGSGDSTIKRGDNAGEMGDMLPAVTLQ
jgi:uncharacterized protein YgiB involved in biofilm formation